MEVRRGIPVSSGVAIGPALMLDTESFRISVKRRTETNPLAAHNLDATQFGWRAKLDRKVKATVSSTRLNHSDFINLPFYDIYPWWDNYLGDGKHRGQWSQSAIPIGDEGR